MSERERDGKKQAKQKHFSFDDETKEKDGRRKERKFRTALKNSHKQSRAVKEEKRRVREKGVKRIHGEWRYLWTTNHKKGKVDDDAV